MLAAALSVILPLVAAEDGPDWNGFRGNNAVAERAKLPDAFKKDGALWRADVPAGYSSPVVSGDDLIVTATEEKSLLTICLDRRTGEERWRTAIEFSGEKAGIGSPSAPTPAADGTGIYVAFKDVGMVAFELDGKERWRQSLGDLSIPHGLAASPVMHGDVVIMQVDEDLKAYLVAFDKRTGEQKWRTERTGFLHGYSSPVIYAPEQGDAEVIVNGSFKICGYSVETGDMLWWVDGAAYAAMTVPVIVGDRCFVNAYQLPTSEFGMPPMTQSFDELLKEHDANEDGFVGKDEWKHEMVQMVWFIIDLDDDDQLDSSEWDVMKRTDTETGAFFAIRLGGRGDISETHVDWRYDNRRGLSGIPSPVHADDALFMVREGGIFTSFDAATGDIVKLGRIGQPDQYYASPVAADGKIVTASISGQVTVIRADKEWEVVSSENLDEEIWSTPALAGNHVYLRTQKAVIAYEAPAEY